MTFKDHFSAQADDYRRYRPHYPAALFTYLAAQAPARGLAWDCGAGNGQAALGLTAYFERVIATDASESQLAQAPPHPRIAYRAAPAEQSGLETGSVDLLTVAQALHWFELDRFYAEARRALRPGGAIAAWCYGLANVTPAVDRVIRHFYDLLGPHWPPERRHIETGYRELPFPFDEWTPPAFAMTASWRLEQLLGYLNTWSALPAYRRRLGCDPAPALQRELQAVWGADPAVPHTIRWPLQLRVGRVSP